MDLKDFSNFKRFLSIRILISAAGVAISILAIKLTKNQISDQLDRGLRVDTSSQFEYVYFYLVMLLELCSGAACGYFLVKAYKRGKVAQKALRSDVHCGMTLMLIRFLFTICGGLLALYEINKDEKNEQQKASGEDQERPHLGFFVWLAILQGIVYSTYFTIRIVQFCNQESVAERQPEFDDISRDV